MSQQKFLRLAKKMAELKESINECKIKKQNLAYINRFMCYVGLPHSETGETSYKRSLSFGGKIVEIYMHCEFGIPFGILARRIMAFLLQQAVIHKTNVIKIGDTQSQFLNNVGVMATCGKRGYLKAVKEQARRVLNCYISVRCEQEEKWEFQNSVFAEKGSILWQDSIKKPWKGEIELSQTLFEDIIKNGVPLEMCVVQQLQSSLEFDMYIWLRWKIHHMKKDTYISWDALFEQFGFGYQKTTQGKLNFKKKFLYYLERISYLIPVKYRQEKKFLLIFTTK